MNSQLYWAIDIGGTKILMVLIDERGKVLFKRKKMTPRPSGPDDIIEVITGTMQEAFLENELEGALKPGGMGICIAGFLDHQQGLIYQSPNLDWHEPVPLAKMLSGKLSCPVSIENDTNAAVVGEVFYGAARGHRHVIYITLSTGIGGGLYLNGRLYRGSDGFAGEIGHTKPFGRGRSCKCGGRDCLEVWASGSALTRTASELWDEGATKNGGFTAAWVFEQADAGNTLAQSIVDQAAANIGLGLSNLVTLLNPSCLVIGGGIAANRADFFKTVTLHLEEQAIKPAVEKTSLKIVAAELEPESGIWGMYCLTTGRAV